MESLRASRAGSDNRMVAPVNSKHPKNCCKINLSLASGVVAHDLSGDHACKKIALDVKRTKKKNLQFLRHANQARTARTATTAEDIEP